MSEKLWYKLARTIVKAGNMPFPVNETLIELLQTITSEDQAKFITKVFLKKPNMNIQEVKERSDLEGEALNKMLKDLQVNGIIVGTQSTTTGITVYRLQPPFPGMFEFQLMRPGESEKEKKLAKLFDKLFEEVGIATGKNYDQLIPQFKNYPAVDRVVPVEEEVQPGEDIILSKEDVKKLIEKYDDIALALCYCRHEKDLLDDSCKIDAPRENCLMLGKTAKFCIEYDFAKKITKDQALKVLKEAEDAGLVHKAFHIHQNPERDLEAICNCCNCCCGIFQLYYRGAMPLHTVTSYIAEVNEEECIGCETCIERCPMEAIQLSDDNKAEVNEEKCIGCGVCAHFCPQEPKAISLRRTGFRNVFVPPPRIHTS
ncbi:MAG: ATP-binding protein [Promethearchaeota archaeon]